MTTRWAVLAGAVTAALGSAGVADAQTPIGDGYGGGGAVAGEVLQAAPGSRPTPAPSQSEVQGVAESDSGEAGEGNLETQSGAGDVGTRSGAGSSEIVPTGAAAPRVLAVADTADGTDLPLTGFDVLLLAAGGLLLVGIGVGVRRLTPAPE